MSASLNEVRLIGNVGADPERITTEGGKHVVNLSLATSTFVADKEFAEWHRLVFWGPLADRVVAHVRKGSSLFVAGRLHANPWRDKEGMQRYGVEVVVEHFQLLGVKAEGGRSKVPGTGAPTKMQKGEHAGQGQNRSKDIAAPF